MFWHHIITSDKNGLLYKFYYIQKKVPVKRDWVKQVDMDCNEIELGLTEEEVSKLKKEAFKKIEDAYFKLGGIYNFDLEEKANSIETFETLLSRFPASEYEPEVLYQLYLLYQEQGDDATSTRYKNQLLENFPESIFAKIIINPNYREESNLASAQLKEVYKEA